MNGRRRRQKKKKKKRRKKKKKKNGDEDKKEEEEEKERSALRSDNCEISDPNLPKLATSQKCNKPHTNTPYLPALLQPPLKSRHKQPLSP